MKIEKMRDTSTEELIQRKEELSKQIFQLRQQSSIGQTEGVGKISNHRRDIARILTLLNERKRKVT